MGSNKESQKISQDTDGIGSNIIDLPIMRTIFGSIDDYKALEAYWNERQNKRFLSLGEYFPRYKRIVSEAEGRTNIIDEKIIERIVNEVKENGPLYFRLEDGMLFKYYSDPIYAKELKKTVAKNEFILLTTPSGCEMRMSNLKDSVIALSVTPPPYEDDIS